MGFRGAPHVVIWTAEGEGRRTIQSRIGPLRLSMGASSTLHRVADEFRGPRRMDGMALLVQMGMGSGGDMGSWRCEACCHRPLVRVPLAHLLPRRMPLKKSVG